MPTIHKVAREANVSIATVSYVLNGSRKVADETRQRVLAAVKRLGYAPNITARNLQASQTRLFGYTWHPGPPDQFNPVLDRFLHAMAEAAARHGYRVLTFPTPTVEEELATYEAMILIGQVDGFVLSNTNLADTRVRALLDGGVPFVAFGRSTPDWDFPWVDVDGTAGLALATRHLLERGHRAIACLAWPEESLTGEYRLASYRVALQEAGLALDPAWIARCGKFYAESYAATARLLALPAPVRPSAIVAMSDLMAAGALNAIWDAHLEPGRDVAVVGFDNSPIATSLRPPLSSISQPIGEVGERLATMLVDLCSGRQPAEQHVLLKPDLIIRESSCAHYER